MAIKHSRGEAKEIAEAAGESTWAFSTGMIHSFKTRTVYQAHVVRFVRWARSIHQIKNLAQLDPRAEALATAWLQAQLAEGKSPYTLQAERAALRLFFGNRTLAQDVAIPRRTREHITRSRGPAAHDRHIQLANWQPLIFLAAIQRHWSSRGFRSIWMYTATAVSMPRHFISTMRQAEACHLRRAGSNRETMIVTRPSG